MLLDLFGPDAAVRLDSTAGLVQALVRVVTGNNGWHRGELAALVQRVPAVGRSVSKSEQVYQMTLA